MIAVGDPTCGDIPPLKGPKLREHISGTSVFIGLFKSQFIKLVRLMNKTLQKPNFQRHLRSDEFLLSHRQQQRSWDMAGSAAGPEGGFLTPKRAPASPLQGNPTSTHQAWAPGCACHSQHWNPPKSLFLVSLSEPVCPVGRAEVVCSAGCWEPGLPLSPQDSCHLFAILARGIALPSSSVWTICTPCDCTLQFTALSWALTPRESFLLSPGPLHPCSQVSR